MQPVSVEISTKGRYQELAQCLVSLANQTYLPKEIIIFDDNKNPIDLRSSSIYRNIFNLLNRKEVQWSVLLSGGVGQVKNHQAALNLSKYPFLMRVDDDTILEPQCLENLMWIMDSMDNVGAVGPSVLHPDVLFTTECVSPFISDCLTKYAQQFTSFTESRLVEHLYSTFLINKSLIKHKYNTELSLAGHREETMFSHEIFRAGNKLVACGNAVAWHMKASEGGIRSYNNNPEYWHADEQVFQRKLKEWGVNINKYKICYLNNGVGDHFCFKKILPEIRAKYSGYKIIISACYPEVFEDSEGCEIVSLNTGRILLNGQVEELDVYKFCSDNNWQGQLINAFRKIYLHE